MENEFLTNCFYVRKKADAIKALNLVKNRFRICEKETFFKKSASFAGFFFVKVCTELKEYRFIYEQYEEIRGIVKSEIKTYNF